MDRGTKERPRPREGRKDGRKEGKKEGREGLIQKAGTDGGGGGCHSVNGLVRSVGRSVETRVGGEGASERAGRKVLLDDEDDDGGFWRKRRGINGGVTRPAADQVYAPR